MCKVPGAGDSTAGLSNPQLFGVAGKRGAPGGGPEAGEGLGVADSGHQAEGSQGHWGSPKRAVRRSAVVQSAL